MEKESQRLTVNRKEYKYGERKFETDSEKKRETIWRKKIRD